MACAYPLIDFYSGKRGDDKGRMIFEIQGWDDVMLEGCHDQIQWMFPLPERSRFNPSAPLLTPDIIEQFRADNDLKEMLRLSFKRMMIFYGLVVEPTGRIAVGPDFVIKSSWLTPDNHNHLRLTRIIRSLRLLGLEAESMELFKCLAVIWANEIRTGQNRITDETFQFWAEAVCSSIPITR